MDSYYARVCWNTNGWRFPSGDAAKAEQYSYAAKSGFGHEEWIFNFAWILNGYKYAFLQPVSDSLERLRGQTIDILLWAITPERARVVVGEIRSCEVLTSNQASEALDYYKSQKWLQQMVEDVTRVKGTQSELGGEGLFNVRFRRKDAAIYEDLPPLGGIPDIQSKFGRYKLVHSTGTWSSPKPVARSRTGFTDIPGQSGQATRQGTAAVEFDPQHEKLQARLMGLLQGQFGKGNVRREGGWGASQPDLVVKHGNRRILIEIKPYPSAKQAIRESLGQIMEYAYCQSDKECSTRSSDLELFIVAPAETDKEVQGYLTLLRTRFLIPVNYCSFTLADDLPKLLRGS